MKKYIALLFVLIFLVGTVSIVLGEETEQQGQNIETEENGNQILKDSEGEVFAVVPKGFEVVENENEFIFTNKDASEYSSVLNIKGHKFLLDKDSQVSFSEKDGIQTINLESGNIQVGDTFLQNIKDTNIQVNEENQIQFAEFTSEKGGIYNFTHNEQNFTFNAKKGGKVLFNPKDGIVEGENTEFSFGDESIEAQKFQGILNSENNGVESLKFFGGVFKDNKRGLEYSSEQDFSIYFDGRDISKEENAISIFDEENRIDVKGFVKIKNPGKLSYTGESQNALVNYHIDSNIFEMQEGDAVIKNGFFSRGGEEEAKQIINIKNGGEEVNLVRQNLDSRIRTESFTIKNKDGKEYIIDEKAGGVNGVVLGLDGKTKVTILQPSLYEEAVNERVKIDKEIEEMRGKLKDLIDSGAISQTEIDAAELGIMRLENIQSTSAGNFDKSIERIENYLYEENPETGELIKRQRIPEAESFAKFTLAEIYNQKVLANEFGEGHLILGEQGGASPLHYKTEVVNGREVVTGWSPDGKEFIPMSQTSIPKNYPTKNFQGREPTKQNIKLINSLRINNNADLLRQAANSRGTRLSGDSPFNTELYKNMRDDYEKSIDLFEEVKNSAYESGNEALFLGASQRLGGMYYQSGESEKAITYFNDVANKVSSKEIKSQAYFSSSIIQMQEQNFAKSLQSIRKSIIANPENVDALTKKIELQGGLLTTIKRKIIGERTALDDALDKKFGAGRGGFLNTVGEVFTKSGHIVRGAIDAPELIFGPIKEGTSGYVISFEGTDYKLSQQELGIRILEDLSKRGYDLNEFADSDSLTQRSILAREMNLDLESEIGKNFLQAVHAAENNHDVNLMLNYGVKKTIKDFGPGGALEETALEEFYLKTGESYESQGVLEAGLGDLVLGEVNLVNVLSFAVPVSTVTIAGKTLTVAGQAGRAARLIPGVSKGSSVVGKFRGVFGKNKWVQAGIGEGIESIPGLFAGEYGLVTEMMTGGSGLIDATENILKKAGRKAGKEAAFELASDALILKNGDVVHKIIFDSSDSLSTFVKTGGDGVRKIDGRLFYIDGKNAWLMSEIPKPTKIELTSKQRKLQWNGKDELVLEIPSQIPIIAKPRKLESLNPKKEFLENGEKFVVFNPGDTVNLRRTIQVDIPTAENIINNVGTATSIPFKESGETLDGFKNYLKDKNLNTVQEVLEQTTRNAPELRPLTGVPTAYSNIEIHYPPEAGKYILEYEIKVPSEKIVSYERGPWREVNTPFGEKIKVRDSKLPDEFNDLSKDDIFKYGFVSEWSGETEITFLGKIPEEYITNIKVLPLADGTPVKIARGNVIDSFDDLTGKTIPTSIAGKEVVGSLDLGDVVQLNSKNINKIAEGALEAHEAAVFRGNAIIQTDKHKYLFGQLASGEGHTRQAIEGIYDGGLEKLVADSAVSGSEARSIIKKNNNLFSSFDREARAKGFSDTRKYLDTLDPKTYSVLSKKKPYNYDDVKQALDVHDLTRNKEMRETFELMGYKSNNEIDELLLNQHKAGSDLLSESKGKNIKGAIEGPWDDNGRKTLSRIYVSDVKGPNGRMAKIESRWLLNENGKWDFQTAILQRPDPDDQIVGKVLERVSDSGWIDRSITSKINIILIFKKNFNLQILLEV